MRSTISIIYCKIKASIGDVWKLIQTISHADHICVTIHLQRDL